MSAFEQNSQKQEMVLVNWLENFICNCPCPRDLIKQINDRCLFKINTLEMAARSLSIDTSQTMSDVPDR